MRLKESEQKSLHYRILQLLKEKYYPSKIAKTLGIKKQSLSRILKRFEQNGWIEKELPLDKNIAHFYRVNINITGYDVSLQSGYKIRPHNYALKFKILTGHEKELPTIKHTRYWDKQYLQEEDILVEKTTQNLIGYLSRPILAYAKSGQDIDNIKATITYIITEGIKQVCQQYGITVDIEHPQVVRKEISVKEPMLDKIPEHIRMRDDIFKKVYPNEVEFNDEVQVKNYINNRALEDFSPELSKKMDFIIEQQVNFAQNLKLHLETLQKIGGGIERLIEVIEGLQELKSRATPFVINGTQGNKVLENVTVIDETRGNNAT